MTRTEIEELETDDMNSRAAGLISRYWQRQGFTVAVGVKPGRAVWSDLFGGLLQGYRGGDALPLSPNM
jgi:hypothetical protein